MKKNKSVGLLDNERQELKKNQISVDIWGSQMFFLFSYILRDLFINVARTWSKESVYGYAKKRNYFWLLV